MCVKNSVFKVSHLDKQAFISFFRFQHGTDSRSSVAQRTVLPNVASTFGNQGGIVMTDDVEPEFVNDHPRTPQSQYIYIST